MCIYLTRNLVNGISKQSNNICFMVIISFITLGFVDRRSVVGLIVQFVDMRCNLSSMNLKQRMLCYVML